jgi:hypothetical protein
MDNNPKKREIQDILDEHIMCDEFLDLHKYAIASAYVSEAIDQLTIVVTNSRKY